MGFNTGNFDFNIKKLIKDKELIIIFSLSIVTFLIAESEIIEISNNFYSTYRPDLYMHFLFGYAVNKFWRLTYKINGLFKNVIVDFYLSLLVHISKEIFDVIRRQNILAFDLLDILAALLGLLIEDIKAILRNKFK